MNYSSTSKSFERLSCKVSAARKVNVKKSGSNVLNNITCRITSSNTCNICQQEHPTSSHAEISRLLQYIPHLGEVFTIKHKIGEGTFSCVYLATINVSSPAGSLNTKGLHQYVALKHLIPTTLPDRILMELDCMHKFGVHPNIIGLHSSVRHGSHVVMVMPYFPHDRFSEYVNLLDISEIGNYMLNLLEALRFVHREGILHRDIKPSNFLYNRKLKRFALVDFGLAQRAASKTDYRASSGSTFVAGPKIPKGEPGKDASEHQFGDETNVSASKTFLRLLPIPSKRVESSQSTSHHQLTIRSSDFATPITSADGTSCACNGQPQICPICLAKPVQSACRAGTPGFRPPEVLLKHPHQTTAVDIWSAGVIFICLLTGRYPFFHGHDDLTALAEIIAIFGTTAIENAAANLGKLVQCSPKNPSIDLKTICERLRPEIKGANAKSEQWSMACDLLSKLLDLNPHTRITASSALQHPLFALKPYSV